MTLQTAKGMKDIMPRDMLIYEKVVDTITKKFKLYGFQPLSTPAIERFDVLSAKYAGGEEILKETFKLKDQGGRLLGLRYDLTVPLARVVAVNKDLKMPFKRYQIGPVWRDGPIGSNRYREFFQCDADTVGCKDVAAESEIILMARDVYAELGLDYLIIINDIDILKGLVSYVGVPDSKINDVIITIDKLKKIGMQGVVKELKEKKVKDESIDKLIGIFGNVGDMSNEELMLYLQKIVESGKGKEWADVLGKGVKNIYTILKYLRDFDINIRFEPSLARALSYYTGPIFEVVLTSSKVSASVGGGGRYDNMIGNFIGGKQKYPSTGFSFGVSRMVDALKEKREQLQTSVELYIIPIKTFSESLKIAEQFRKAGINTAVDIKDKGISKNLDYANSIGVPFVAIIGGNELEKKKIKLKDMKTGKEKMVSVKKAIKEVKKHD